MRQLKFQGVLTQFKHLDYERARSNMSILPALNHAFQTLDFNPGFAVRYYNDYPVLYYGDHLTYARLSLDQGNSVGLISELDPRIKNHPVLGAEPRIVVPLVICGNVSRTQPTGPLQDFYHNPSTQQGSITLDLPTGVTTVPLGTLLAQREELRAVYLLRSAVIYTAPGEFTETVLTDDEDRAKTFSAVQNRLALLKQMLADHPDYTDIAFKLMSAAKGMLNPDTDILAANTALWAGRAFLYAGKKDEAVNALQWAYKILLKRKCYYGTGLAVRQIEKIKTGSAELICVP